MSFFTGLLAFLVLAAESGADTRSIGPIAMTVSNLETAEAFYRNALDFNLVTGSESEQWGEELERTTGVFGARARSERLKIGGEQIELIEFLAPEGAPFPPGTRSNDAWFQHIAIVTADMAKAYEHLRALHVRHGSPGPQKLPDWNPNAGGIEAFYFRDPDGHHLEVIHFPAGKGDPKWQHSEPGRLFLGIDHTAIVVADTGRSLAFYRDALGLEVAGRSENYGPEQERLNNVFGAHLQITALRVPGSPGVELLEYLSPTDGRPMPHDARLNDLVSWRTQVANDDPRAAAEKLSRAGGRLISSPAPNQAPTDLLVRDPDGHVVELVRP
jgi:catechol 2,3-dioxygenase-like lactoylglutathione lyase family enzyme